MSGGGSVDLRLHVRLRREGYAANRKRIYRLYREERLMVRKRGGRKRALGTPAPMILPMVLPMAANMRWSLDFVSDQMTSGRRSVSCGGSTIDLPGHVDEPFQAKQQWSGMSSYLNTRFVLRRAEEPDDLPAILWTPD